MFERRPKQRAPPVGDAWVDPANYKVVIRGQWKRREHVNVLEGRASLQALRRAARNRSSWNKKMLGITDSQVIQGAFAKGRCSSFSLLRLCRRAAAIQMGLGIRLKWRYIRSKDNPADGPSRGRKVPGSLPPGAWTWKGHYDERR